MSSALAVTASGSRAAEQHLAHEHGGRLAARVGFGGVIAIVACAPFEATRPLVSLPGQSISSLETVLLLAVAAWTWAALSTRTMPAWRTSLTVPGAVLLGILTIAALAAPYDRANAVHMVGRLILAAGLFLLTVNAVTTTGRGRTLALVVSAIGTAAAILVILDFVHLSVVQRLLAPFRMQVATVGAQVRASGPFQYPTIASMFLEIAFACGAGLLPLAVERRRTGESLALSAASLITAAAIVLTYTRAGLITMATSLIIVAGLRLLHCGWDSAAVWLAGIAAAIAIMIPLSRSSEAIRLRMVSEGQDGWYAAQIEAPARITMATGSRIAVPVKLTNIGQVTWDSTAPQPFGFSYHWLLGDSDRIVSWEGIRSFFAEPVKSGDQVTVVAQLEAPRQPGEYRIVWDLYQEHLLWFSTEPDAGLTMSSATVSGAWSGPALDPGALPPLPKRTVRPGRRVLWTAALRMLAAHPWLGIGADNFRLEYGPFADLPRSDPRVHTNNMYLELVVGGGLAAAAALVWLAWRVLGLLIAAGRRMTGSDHDAATAGAMAAVVAIALHGLVDSFLSFTATYAVMAIVLGLLVACSRMAATHAHRI